MLSSEQYMSSQTQPRRPPKRPNTYSVTGTTVPTLATVLIGFSVAVLGIAWATDFPELWWKACVIELSTKQLASGFLGLSSLLLLFATIAAIHSQSFNFLDMADLAQKNVRLQLRRTGQNETKYVQECMNNVAKWHGITVWLFDIGLLFLLTGVGILFVPATIFLSIIFWVAAVSILGWSIAMIPKS